MSSRNSFYRSRIVGLGTLRQMGFATPLYVAPMTGEYGVLYIDAESIIEDDSDSDHMINNSLLPDAEMVINIGAEGTYDTYHAHYPCVIKESDTSYKMWYSGYDNTNVRIMYATSTDGHNWSNHAMVIDIDVEGTYDIVHAYNPCVIKESDTSYKMWYCGRTGTTDRILYATSTNGTTWSNHAMVLNINAEGTYDTDGNTHPSIIKESDTSYKMWYSGYDGTNWRILYATSTNGTTWSNHQMVINYNVEGDTSYKIWYVGNDGTNYRIIYATSANGTTWSNHEMVININVEGTYDTDYLYSPTVIKESDTSYKMWYSGHDGSNYRILYATSANGVHWGNPDPNAKMVMNIGDEGTYDTNYAYKPCVIKESDISYKMWYTGYDGTNQRIIYATSTDGHNWANHQLVLNINQEGTYDTTQTAFPCVIKESDTSYKMWYMGKDASNWRCIYATSANGITWTGHTMVVDIGDEGTYDTATIYSPYVIKESASSYKMWYAGYDSSTYRIIYCTSTNGTTWTGHTMVLERDTEGTYDTGTIYDTSIIKESDTSYKMWYTGGDGTNYRIMYATSANGTNWTNHEMIVDKNVEGTYDSTNAHQPYVIKESDTSYKMWYAGSDGSNNRILYASSRDGRHWGNFVELDYSEKKYGASSMSFGGTTEHLSIPDSTDWTFGGDDMSIDFWIRFDEIGTVQWLLSQWISGASTSWLFQKTAANEMQMIVTGAATLTDTTTSLAVDTWYHIAFTYDGTTYRLFVDGVIVDSDAGTYSFDDVSASICIGGVWDTTDLTFRTGTQVFDGYMDNIRITKGEALWTSNFDVDDDEEMFY